ncbi:hypothetical protein BDZ88DRAFT_510350 [Geranomyces variabilis]|nr:hypothetical protein BDZ88DRAFT_510350 [Geranomyces variabilis]KAJ3131866.1 hypothetical protein HDU90_007695 [Geranomyces variabilis]
MQMLECIADAVMRDAVTQMPECIVARDAETRNADTCAMQMPECMVNAVARDADVKAIEFNQWLAFQVQHRLAFENCYAATTRWRRRQFEAFRLARKSKDQFVNRLRKQFGQDPLIIMGDWSAAPRSMRFQPPIKTARFRRMLRRHHLMIDHKVCGAIVKSGFRTRQSPRPWRKGHTVGVHGLLGCTSRNCTKEQWTPDSDLSKCVRYHNRDRASVGNFEHIIREQIVKEGERPAHLSRGDHGKNL